MAPSSGRACSAALLLAILACLCPDSARCQSDAPKASARSLAEKAKDPWPGILAGAQRARPSPVYSYVDKGLAMVDFAIPCLGSRLCECSVQGGWNRTFWLNMASATFRGEVYVAILHRKVVWQTSVTFKQEQPGTAPLAEQVVEVNQILLCKMGNITTKPELQDCQLVEPGANYREKHPAGYSKHFQLVGLNDPRLVSAGDESGLFLQVGCRPKVLSDSITTSNYKHLRANFRETLCVIKVRPGTADKQQQPQQQTATATASRSLMSAHAAEPLQLAAQEAATASAAAHGDSSSSSGSVRALLEDTQQPGPLPGVTIASKDWPVGQLMHLQPPSWTHFYEKSWVSFEYKGTLLWSRFLLPHEVVTVHANGTSTTLYSTNSSNVFRPLSSVCGKGPRGNTPAVRIKAEKSGLPVDVYLGILHYTPRRGARRMSSVDRQCDEYLNFFYLMEAEPPFALLEVAGTAIPIQAATNPILDAEPLSLGMGFISFPAGLIVVGDEVVVTYGSGDREVRIWRTPLSNVIGSFLLSWKKNLKKPAL